METKVVALHLTVAGMFYPDFVAINGGACLWWPDKMTNSRNFGPQRERAQRVFR
jgi:hypothetical protein